MSRTLTQGSGEALNMYLLQDAMKAISAASQGPIQPIVDTQGLMIGIASGSGQNYCCPIQPNRLRAHAPDVVIQCQTGNCAKASQNDVQVSNQRLNKVLKQITSDFDEPGKMWVIRDMELANNMKSSNSLKKRIRIDKNNFNSSSDEPKMWITDVD